MLALLFLTATVAAARGMWSPCGLSMLTSLNPVAERARGNRFWVTACWYACGAVAGGAVLGAGCALGARAFAALDVSRTVAWSIVLAGAVLAVLSDTRVGGWSLPLHPRQVDERWLTKYRRWIYAGGYGVQIGSGFATYIMTAGVYLTAVLAVVDARVGAAFGAGVLFGLVRGLSIVVAGLARDPGRLHAIAARVDALTGWSAFAASATAGVVAAVAAGRLSGAAVAAAVAAGALAAALRLLRQDLGSAASPLNVRWSSASQPVTRSAGIGRASR